MNKNANTDFKNKKKKTKKIVMIVLAAIFIPVLLLAGLIGWFVYQEAKEEHWFEYQAMIRAGVKSDELTERGLVLGLNDISQIPVYRIDQEKMFGLEGKDGGTLKTGCYEDASTCEITGIFIRNGLQGDDLDAILAHEYLHAMYTMHKVGSDTALEKNLREVFANTPKLSSVSLVSYSDEDRTAEEVFAYACTDAQDKWLTAYVIEKCNLFIDRSKIVHLY